MDTEWRIIEQCPPTIETDTPDAVELSSIHVVGDRTASETFFSAKDIANLVDVTKVGYIYNNVPHDNRVKIRVSGTLAVYLDTYGFMIYILSTRRGQATGYAKWAMGIVAAYTTKDVAKIVELSAPSLQLSLRGSNVGSPIPGGVYLIYAGTVRDLKGLCDTLPENLEDDYRVYKFGRSDNLHRRLGEHDNGFPGSTLAFAMYIHQGSIAAAEAAIADIVSKHSATVRFPLKKQREVFAVSATLADGLVDQLYNECRDFGAKSVNLDKLIADHELVRRDLDAENELVRRDLRAADERVLLTEQANRQVIERLNAELTSAHRASDDMRAAYLELTRKYDDARDQLMDFALQAPARKRARKD